MRGPLLKIERADHHIRQLEEAFARYIRANLKAMRGERDPKTGQFRYAQIGLPLPEVTALIIGDAVHNLRVSLDHAYWVVVENNGGVWADKIKFPFFGDRPSAEGSINGQPPSSRPSREVLDYIFGEVEPFPGGSLALYDLHKLDITDKHQLLLPTKLALTVTDSAHVVMADPIGGPTIMVGPEDGAGGLIMSTNQPILRNYRGPIQYTGDLQSGLTILFGDGPLGDQGVLETLRTLSKNCLGTIKGLDALMI
jgi:hypothetical protein